MCKKTTVYGNTTLSGGFTYTYDFENHLKTRNGTPALSFAYDHDGNRVSKTVAGVTTYFLVDEQNPTHYPQVVEESSAIGANPQVLKTYNFGLRLISQRSGSTVQYYGHDGHGSVRLLTDSSGNLLNTSFGMYPSVALNVPVSIYPRGAASFFAKWKQSEKLAIQAAVFDGAPFAVAQNPYNVMWNLNPSKGLFSTLEIQYREIGEGVVKGNYKAGGYYHDGTFTNLADSTQSVKGSYGLYLTLDRLVIPENKADNQGLTVFLQGGSSPSAGNLVNFYLCPGLSYTGLIPSRPKDILSLGMVYSAINNKLNEKWPTRFTQSRSLVEINYKAMLGNHFSVQPDLQYIINPGANPSFSNCIVGMLRLGVVY